MGAQNLPSGPGPLSARLLYTRQRGGCQLQVGLLENLMLIEEGWCAKEEGGEALLCNGEFVPFIRRDSPSFWWAGMLVLDKLVRWGLQVQLEGFGCAPDDPSLYAPFER